MYVEEKTRKTVTKPARNKPGRVMGRVMITFYLTRKVKKSFESLAQRRSAATGEKVTTSQVLREALSWYLLANGGDET